MRLTIIPDGGVARLRLLGEPLVDVRAAADPGGRLDLAATIHGGLAVACSDEFYSSPSNLIMVGDGRDMGDGWETRRRRGPGEDWAVIRLASEAVVERLELDTTNFKGNFPDRCAVDGIALPDGAPLPDEGWVPLLAEHPMQPHLRHVLPALAQPPVTHVRLRSIPDGGVSRLRVHGQLTDEGRRRNGLRLLNALVPHAAERHLLACCASTAWAAALTRRRPFADPDALHAAAEEVWAGLPSR